MQLTRNYFSRILTYYLLFIFASSIFICYDAECIHGRFEMENCTSIINYLIYPQDIDQNSSTTTNRIQGTDIDGKWCCSIQVIPSINYQIEFLLLPYVSVSVDPAINLISTDIPTLIQPPRA